MKEELGKADNKAFSPVPAARARTGRTKESPRTDSANGSSAGLKTRPKPPAPSQDVSNNNKVRRSILTNRTKPVTDIVETSKQRDHEDSRATGFSSRSRLVEQYARLQRRTDANNCKGSELEATARRRDLQTRPEERDKLVSQLQSEIMALKAQLGKLQRKNIELDSENKKLSENLSAAETKIKSLAKSDKVASVAQEVQPCASGDEQNFFTNIESISIKESLRGESFPKGQSLALEPTKNYLEVQSQFSAPLSTPDGPVVRPPVPRPPPPPPPPPQSRKVAGKASTVGKASTLVELYRSLTQSDGKKNTMASGACPSPHDNIAHNSIVGELQNRSPYLLAIKADVETKGDLIKHLIEKVESVSCIDMDDVLTFVDWLDGELSTLVDEAAVLKHFSWPEKKVDAMREAAFEYCNLKRLESEIFAYKDDSFLPCEATLKKISYLLDKLEQNMQRLIKLRDATMLLYKDCKIPTDWMLDSGMVSKMKLASVKLAKAYLRRVSLELASVHRTERESAQQTLLLQGVRFAYRAHQFSGGLDSETMFALEELKKRIQTHGKET